MDKQQKLNEVAGKIAQTKGGPFGPGLNPVPGEGDPDAQIMFIGEGPGFHENRLGRPFVGVSGQLLRKTLVENDFKESEVFITNIVKFRPPENRDPTPQEIEFFKPFLDEQIEIISPKIIVTLGRFSMYKFLGEGVSISRIHGQARKMGKYLIFPMFHPAAALRDGSMMRQFKEDFGKLKDLLAGKPVNFEKKTIGKKLEEKQLELI
jgi:DNA polymerase